MALAVAPIVGMSLGALGTAPAGATTNLHGTISGTITATGSAVATVCADVYAASDVYVGALVASGCSNTSGAYTVATVPIGQYLVEFVDKAGSSRHDGPQWYSGAATPATTARTAGFVKVTSGSAITGIDAVMQPGGWITGKVTNAATGAGIGTVCVRVYTTGGTLVWSTCSRSGSTPGTFSTTGLAAGQYKVAFNACHTCFQQTNFSYTSQWWNDKSSFATATPVTVSAGLPSAGIDASLESSSIAATASISGTVKGTTGSPLAGVSVEVESATAQGFVGGAATASTGGYDVPVPKGAFKVDFFPGGPAQTYVSQYYDGKASYTLATVVTVPASTSKNLGTTTLTKGGAISGKVVTGTTGLPGITVLACPATGTGLPRNITQSAVTGTYTLHGVVPGTYHVVFEGTAFASTGKYLTQVYPTVVLSTSYCDAPISRGTDVTVAAGHTHQNVNDTLTIGATISGKAYDAETGALLKTVCAELFATSGTGYAPPDPYTCTGTRGSYITAGLAPGTYTIDFVDPAGRYLPQWDGAKTSEATAIPLTVDTTDVTGVDATMKLGSSTTVVTPPVTTEPSTTTLRAITSPVYPGSESQTFSGTVTGLAGHGNPTGTVTVKTTYITLCTTSMLAPSGTDAASFSCASSTYALPSGTFAVTATYSGGTSTTSKYGYTGSGSAPAQVLTVATPPTMAPTTTTLNSITAPVTFGSESESFTGTVTGVAGDGNPTGTVMVTTTTGTDLCTTSSLASAGTDTATFTCTLSTGSLLALGTYTVIATYLGGTSTAPGFRYTMSSSMSQSFSVTVASEISTTTLNSFTSPVTFGSESESFSGTVTGVVGDGNPTGTVMVATTTGADLCTTSSLAPAGTDAATYTCTLSTSSLLAVGTYTVIATYLGGTSMTVGYSYTASSSPTKPLTVRSVVTRASTTTVLHAPASTAFGSESETFSGTVTGAPGDGDPTGTVTVTATTGKTLCATSILTSSGTDSTTFSCALSNGTLLGAGLYGVTARYSGGPSVTAAYSYTPSVSAPEPFTVTRAAAQTTTTLGTIASPKAYGSESQTFTGTVVGVPDEGNPSGTVAVSATGENLCATSNFNSSGTGTVSFSCTQTDASLLGAGTHTVTATYSGGTSSTPNYTYSGSNSASQTLRVTSSAPTTTTLNPITSPTTFGSESQRLSGTVTGTTGDGYPTTGTVTVTATGTTLCSTASLTSTGTDAATFACTMGTGVLGVGVHSVTATYSGATSTTPDYTYTKSTSTSQTLTVTPASKGTTTTLNAITSPQAVGSESQIFTGTVTGIAGDGTPTGTVTVTATSTTLCATSILTPSTTATVTFSCTLSTGSLVPGTYSVTAAYSGGASSTPNYAYAGSVSASQALRVTSPASTTTTLDPITSPETFGSESQSFSGTVAGAIGEGDPAGTVAVRATGTTLCSTGSLAPTGTGIVSFTCTQTKSTLLTPGSYKVSATYSGGTSTLPDYAYTPSSSAPAQDLTVSPATESTTTTLDPITSPETFGSESQSFTGTVTGVAGDGSPSGTVTVQATATTLCSATSLTPTGTDAATFTCTQSNSSLLAARTYKVTAAYSGGASTTPDYTYTSSTSSPAQPLRVTTSEPTTVTLDPLTSPVTAGSESQSFTGTVTGVAGDGSPSGTVTVQATATTLCSATSLTPTGTDAATFTCTQSNSSLLSAATYKVTASYSGGASSTPAYTYTGSTSTPARTLTVNPRPAPSSPPAPTPPAGASSHQSCSVPSGTCHASNDGVTVTASTGPGALTVSQYGSNPGGPPSFTSTGEYFDVAVAPGSGFSSATITDCNLNGGSSLFWWNPTTSAWDPVSPESGPTGTPACVTATLSATSHPAIGELTGTVFAVGTLPPPAPIANRVSGETADATAAAEFTRAFPYAKDSCPPTRSAVVATTAVFQDALSSQFLAQHLTTGTLLTPTQSLAPVTAATLKDEGISTVYVVGGPLAVSTTVVSAIEGITAYGCGGSGPGGKISVKRVYGQTAYGTAEAVDELVGSAASKAFPGAYATSNTTGGSGTYNDTAGSGTTAATGSVPTAILASGQEFQDAQSASVIAYHTQLPLLLTPGGTLSTTAVAAIEKLGVRQVLLVGGPLAVSNAVEQALVEKTGVSVVRVAGKDATDTARELARFEAAAATSGLDWTFGHRAMVSRGNFFTDGLAGAVLDNAHNATTGPAGTARPLLVTESPTLVGPYLTTFLKTTGHAGIDATPARTLSALTVLGGPLAVSTAEVAAMETDLGH